MNASLGASIALGFTLAVSLFNLPAIGASSPRVGQGPAFHHTADFAKAKALASPATPTPRASEKDGLSRNVDDCNYGCIDNGH